MRLDIATTLVLSVGAALWTQLSALPLAAVGLGNAGLLALVFASLALAALPTAIALLSRSRTLAVTILLAAFPVLLGLQALATSRGGVPRFDPAARTIAAITAFGFLAAALHWTQQSSPAFRTEVRPIDPSQRTRRRPPLAIAAPLVLSVLAFVVAVVMPAVLLTRERLTRAERLAGPALVHGREALTAAGGLAIGLWLVLSQGSLLARNTSQSQRRATRGLALLLWGVAFAGLRMLLDQLR